MLPLLALALTLAPPPRDHWFAADKVKHFLLSAMVESVTYSASRALGADRRPAVMIGAGLTIAVGVGRELHDQHVGKGASGRDLVWDALGGLAAASLMNGTR
jgi:putative lipoprotein